MKRTVISALCALSLTFCTKMCSEDRRTMSAEQVLEAYLEIAFNMKEVQQKHLLMAYTTGSLKDSIAGANDATIKQAYIDPRYKLEQFSIIERKDQTPKETEITYLLKYKELPNAGADAAQSADVSTENTVGLIREKEGWYIQSVLGNKSSIEFPLAASPVINPQAAPAAPAAP